MRFLFVYQDYARQAQTLLDELSVRDVTLVIVRKDATGPTAEELAMLRAHQGADAAACEVVRKYRKVVAPFVTFCCEPKKFRFEDQQLREWLVPKDRVTLAYEKPSVAFMTAATQSPRLVLHPHALETANELVEHRFEFATLGARLLGRYADGAPLGSPRDWKSSHGVDFAANGPVSFKYHATCGDEARQARTEWHLKAGDRTTRNSAARIYFARVEFVSGARILVFHVGPHPENGEYFVSVTVPELA